MNQDAIVQKQMQVAALYVGTYHVTQQAANLSLPSAMMTSTMLCHAIHADEGGTMVKDMSAFVVQ